MEAREVVGYECYRVWSDGRIESCRKDKLKWVELKPKIDRDGYKCVKLFRREFFVHRLVAIAFIENLFNYPQVNHRNGIKTDNRVDNLEWCTHKQNMEHAKDNGFITKNENHVKAKLTNAQVREIRKKGLSMTRVDLAKEYGVSRFTIGDIMLNKTWIGIC